ncbi:MAG: hypothetical protein IIB77_07785 [Proteobacteria bacterium]|nr:hypothetical protein [Pseudomonadota bacterium]
MREVRLRTAVAAYTMAIGRAMLILDADKGAGSTITTLVALAFATITPK